MTAKPDQKSATVQEPAQTLTYVYLLRSKKNPQKTYIGKTNDLTRRQMEHNGGHNPSTAHNRPWELITYHAFNQAEKAETFEAYLKTGSGRAFAKKHLW